MRVGSVRGRSGRRVVVYRLVLLVVLDFGALGQIRPHANTFTQHLTSSGSF